MKRRDFLGLTACFMVGEDMMAQPKGLLMPGSERVGGDLRGLQASRLVPKDQFLLVYFGTAHRVPNCSADLMALADAAARINRVCGRSVVSPVFVYPAPDRGRENIETYVEKAGSIIIGVSGERERVLTLARGYSARYSSDFNAHTRFAYLMNPQGRNVAIASADVLLMIDVREWADRLKSPDDRPICVP